MSRLEVFDTDAKPICPHCEKELDRIARVAKGIIEQTMVFICPFCRKVLSIGYNIGW